MIDFLMNIRKHKTSLDEQIQRIEQSEFNYVWEKRETKQGEEVVIYHQREMYDEFLIIHLIGVVKGILSHNKIGLGFTGENMEILDIEVLQEKDMNRGYGSILLSEGLSVAKQRMVKKVTGRIMTTNDIHYSRQVHFYKKFGFIIEKKLDLYLELEK